MEVLPKCVYFKHGSYYLVKQGKWHFLTKDTSEISNQLFLRFGFIDGKVPHGWKEPLARSALELYLISVLGRAKQNAKGRKIKEFEIDQEHVLGLLKKCGYRCSVTNTPFSLEVISHDGRKPFAPSIDRIDSAVGYVQGNWPDRRLPSREYRHEHMGRQRPPDHAQIPPQTPEYWTVSNTLILSIRYTRVST